MARRAVGLSVREASSASAQSGPTADGTGEPEDASPPDEPTSETVRFGVVLLLLLTTFLFLASGPTGAWVPLVSTLLQGATLLGALRASRTERRLFRLTAVVVAVAALTATVAFFTSSTKVSASFFGLNALLVAAAPVPIVRGVVRRRVVDIQ